MAYFHFIWTDEIVRHIDEHGITTQDFEDIVCHPLGTSRSKSSGLPAAFGYTSDGRYVIAIYQMIDETTVLPVTAYKATEP